MKHYAVEISSRALEDMEKLHDYISYTLFAPEAAANLYDRIADSIESLSIFPNRFRLIDCEPERSEGIRSMVVEHYSVFYSVAGARVTVLRVLYSASDAISRLRGTGGFRS